jgi:hypothetical protein
MSQCRYQCDNIREWLIVPLGGVYELKPLKRPLALPIELMSKSNGRTGFPPSSTLRIYNHRTKSFFLMYCNLITK